MKIDLYEVNQYTDTKLFYITRLESIDDQGNMSKRVVRDGIRTKQEAKALLKAYNDNGLKPAAQVS